MLRLEDYYRDFHEVEVFKATLQDVREMLDNNSKELQERYQFLQREQKRYQSNADNIEKAIIELKMDDVRFAFLHEDVMASLVNDLVKKDYSYKRLEFISQLKTELTRFQAAVVLSKEQLETKCKKFISFCEQSIFYIKLRQTCVSGIDHKQTYDEVMQWQEKMRNRIHRTVKIAEEDMREHDKQLQQFISHLHLYLRRISNELRLIPKQTRVKVEDKVKEIFVFSVPD